MRKIVANLENDLGLPLSDYSALEFCAREGEWQTHAYCSRVKRVCAWEIDPRFLPKLTENLPAGSEITIGDSFELAELPANKHRFDFIVLDNPLCIHGGKCEHFEALELLPLLAKKEVTVVFNVNVRPYDYHLHPDWAVRRKAYYGTDASLLPLDFCLDFYQKKLTSLGFHVDHLFPENRAPADYLYAFATVLSRTNES